MVRTSPLAYRVVVCLLVVYLVLFFKLSIAFQTAVGIALAPLLVERVLALGARLRHAPLRVPAVPGR